MADKHQRQALAEESKRGRFGMNCSFGLRALALLVSWVACWTLSKPQAGFLGVVIGGIIVQLANSFYFMGTDGK